MNCCRKIIMVAGFCFFVAEAYAAVDYQSLAVEQHRNDLKDVQKTITSAPEDSVFAKEKAMLSQQLSVITGDEDTKYLIVPGDTLTVTYQDRGEKVSNVYQVDSRGEIHMNLVGSCKVSGLTRQKAREAIGQLFDQYIRRPDVSVLINNSGNFMIVGAARPGVYELKPNLTVMEALLKAGYDERRANMHTVIIMRGGRDKPEIQRLNLAKMLRKGDRSDNILVKPGDLIYVPNSLIYDFDTFKDKMFSYLLDYYTLGGATIIQQKQTQDNTGTAQP